MNNIFPPSPRYPYGYDNDRTLLKVYNTSEALLTKDNEPWSEEVHIKPVKADQPEQWGLNGYANIDGELFYYDGVEFNENDKIKTLKRCIRNISGTNTKFVKKGTPVRGFVIAEHHNQLLDAAIQLEEFILSNETEIDLIADSPVCLDDNECPDVVFNFDIVNENECEGTLIEYFLNIAGPFNQFRIDFGDGNFTNSSQSGVHTYSPNSNIDPVVIVSNNFCEIVQTPPVRNNLNEPNPVDTPNNFIIPIPEIPDIPDITVPIISTPENAFTLPPIQQPCITAVGGEYNIPSIIVVDPPINIPSIVIFEPELNIPSLIIFDPPIELPSYISVDTFELPSYISVDQPNIPSFIEFGNVNIPSFIDIAPVNIPSEISLIIPEISDISLVVPEISDISLIVPDISIEVPSFPDISINTDIPDLIIVVDDIPNIIRVDVPDIPPISVDFSVPDIPPISIEIPSFPPIEIPPISFPDIRVIDEIPNTITLIDNLPNLINVEFGTPPPIPVEWGTPPTVTVDINCPGGGDNASLRQGFKSFGEFESEEGFETDEDLDYMKDLEMPELEVEYNSIGIPSEIVIRSPKFDPIQFDTKIPETIKIEGMKDEIRLVMDQSIPTEIELLGKIPETIKIESNLPSSIVIEGLDKIPKEINLNINEDFPTEINLNASEIPTEIKVTGVPDTIELIHDLPNQIELVMPEDMKIRMVYEDGPIPLKFETSNPFGNDDDDLPCFTLAPCPKK